jgi:hypothetical protein
MRTKLGVEEGALRSEWGHAHDQNVSVGKSAATALGIDEATIDKMESVMGYSGVMKFFHNIGSKIGEDSFVGGDKGGGSAGFKGALSPHAAQERLTALRGDPEYVKKYLAGNVEAKQEMENLHRWAFQGTG